MSDISDERCEEYKFYPDELKKQVESCYGDYNPDINYKEIYMKVIEFEKIAFGLRGTRSTWSSTSDISENEKFRYMIYHHTLKGNEVSLDQF